MSKAKKKSDKQWQRAVKSRKRNERATRTQVKQVNITGNKNRCDQGNVDLQKKNVTETECRSGDGERSMNCDVYSQNKMRCLIRR